MRFSMKICIFMALILGLILDGIRQFTGYALGAGDSKEKLSKYEFHRYWHIRLQDIQAIQTNEFILTTTRPPLARVDNPSKARIKKC